MFLLPNARDVIKVGRRETTNDKICNGVNVSRNHLQLVRKSHGGVASDWQNIRWSVKDLGMYLLK